MGMELITIGCAFIPPRTRLIFLVCSMVYLSSFCSCTGKKVETRSSSDFWNIEITETRLDSEEKYQEEAGWIWNEFNFQ